MTRQAESNPTLASDHARAVERRNRAEARYDLYATVTSNEGVLAEMRSEIAAAERDLAEIEAKLEAGRIAA